MNENYPKYSPELPRLMLSYITEMNFPRSYHILQIFIVGPAQKQQIMIIYTEIKFTSSSHKRNQIRMLGPLCQHFHYGRSPSKHKLCKQIHINSLVSHISPILDTTRLRVNQNGQRKSRLQLHYPPCNSILHVTTN
jgi:hypothetical protein